VVDAGSTSVKPTVVDLNMAYYFAIVPARSPELAQAELNAFLRSHRVLTVDRRWVELGENSYWAICVDYLEPGGAGAGPQPKNGARGKIDYRERLSAEDFAIFDRLRQLRKESRAGEPTRFSVGGVGPVSWSVKSAAWSLGHEGANRVSRVPFSGVPAAPEVLTGLFLAKRTHCDRARAISQESRFQKRLENSGDPVVNSVCGDRADGL